MSTDQKSIEDMLEDEQETAAVAEPTPDEAQTGDTGTAPPADAISQQPKTDDGPLVPRKALEDERRKRQEIERRLQESQRATIQQPIHQSHVEVPDPFADPQGYTQFVVAQAAQVAAHQAREQAEVWALNRELNRSEKRARKEHGDDVVEQAMEAAERAGVILNFLRADDAYDEMVRWYSDYQIATNPASYRDRLEAEILAKHGLTPGGGQRQPQQQRAPVPKSLASAASAQPRDTRGRFTDEPTPLEDILP